MSLIYLLLDGIGEPSACPFDYLIAAYRVLEIVRPRQV
jgi:hypothetical protein